MKAEIANLSRLIEQGGAIALTQESSLQEIVDSIAGLKKEIGTQAVQLSTMIRDLQDNQKQLAESTDGFDSLCKTYADLTAKVEAERSENRAMAEEAEKAHGDIRDLKAAYEVSQAESGGVDRAIRQKKSALESLAGVLREDQRNIQSLLEDKRLNLQSVRTRQKVYEDRMHKNRKVEEETARYDQRFLAQDDSKAKLLIELKEVEAQSDKSRAGVVQAKAEAKVTADEKAGMRRRLTTCRNEVFLMAAEKTTADGVVQADRRGLEEKRISLTMISDQKGAEIHEKKFVENQNVLITNEMLGMKINAHKQRETVEILGNEIDHYQRNASASRSNHIQVDEEVRIRWIEMAALNQKLTGLLETTRHHLLMIEAMQNERDLGARQLQAATEENAVKVVENSDLAIDIRRLKDEIREKDKLCLETHMKVRLTHEDIERLTKKNADLHRSVRECDDKTTELRNQIQRGIFLMSQADLDTVKQKQVVSDLSSSLFSLNTSVTNRTREIAVIKQKIHNVSGLLGMGNMGYLSQAEQLDSLRAQLLTEVERCRGLKGKVHHRRALQMEEIRLMKAMIKEGAKCRALEDELEKPLNVHRWRFLDGTNPHMAQLLKMNHELRERLMFKITVLAHLRQVKRRLKRASEKLEIHLVRGYNGNINDEFEFLNGALHQKARQLAMIESQVLGQTPTIQDHQGQVRTIRSMVRVEKAQLYDTKQKISVFRSPTGLGRSHSKISEQNDVPESHFIGGGFAVAGVVRPHLDASPAKNRVQVSVLVSPQIIHPKSISMLQKKPPRGWNANRGPLRPMLPTVAASP
jgi:hypothetical protein